MKGTISKPVIAIVILGIALTAYFVWDGISRHRRANIEEASLGPTKRSSTTDDVSGARESASLMSRGTVLTAPVPLPLSALSVDLENGTWTGDEAYRSVPRGTQTFGVEFHIEGMLQMQGTSSAAAGRQYRNKIRLPLIQARVMNAQMGSIHLLGGTTFGSEPGTEVAELVWHYSDGATRRQQLIYDEHIRDWNRVPYEELAHLPYAYSKVVWRAEKANPAGRWLRLYRVTLGNPEPAKAVRQIELVSGRGSASLLVVAATLDPLGPGMRPDDSLDLEPTDALPPQLLDMLVQSSEGQALPGASVGAQWGAKTERSLPGSRQTLTDTMGKVRVAFPPGNINRLEITVSHEQFASRKMVWDLVAGDVIPSSYTMKLVAGVNIGGVIVDGSDFPVEGAKLSFHRFWESNDERNRKGEQSEFNTHTTSSDSRGTWQVKNLPRDMLANIRFLVEHSDYLGTNFTAAWKGEMEKQLRAGTHRIVLHRRLDVRGLVTDENGGPITDATVWVGRSFFGDRRQSHSDSFGRFEFQSITDGDVFFSAMAKGRAPASKTFKVQPGMQDILLKLGAGVPIRGVVQTEAGEPIADVQVMLGNHSMNGPGYEFSTKTDVKGRFIWEGAPNEGMSFNLWKRGYVQRRNVSLKLNEENIVTLRTPREVQGWVVDADSGKAVTKFRAAVGHSSDPDQFYSNYSGPNEFSDANGQFAMSLEDEEQNAIRLGADDYADQIQSVPDDKDGVIKMEFRLKPSAALQGTVVARDGTILPGVQVALTKEGFGGRTSVRWSRGRFESHRNGAAVVLTDASGKFTINSPPESGAIIVALGDGGFASATAEQLRANGILVLQPFGQVEGVLKIGGQPAIGMELLFTLQNLGVMTDFEQQKVETDGEGKFKFEKLPGGEGQIVRLIKSSPNSWTHSHTTSVMVEPGQTVFVTIGDSGAQIKGHVRLETPPPDGEVLTIGGMLHTSIGKPPAFNTPAETQAFYRGPEWGARMKQHKTFAFVVNPDGTFVVDSVPPGSYSLTLSAYAPENGPFGIREGGPGSSKTLELSVPDNPDPLVAIDMGEIILSAPARRSP